MLYSENLCKCIAAKVADAFKLAAILFEIRAELQLHFRKSMESYVKIQIDFSCPINLFNRLELNNFHSINN
jgi:hypothetical protein